METHYASRMCHLPSFTTTLRWTNNNSPNTCWGIVNWTCVFFFKDSVKDERPKTILGRMSYLTWVWPSALLSKQAQVLWKEPQLKQLQVLLHSFGCLTFAVQNSATLNLSLTSSSDVTMILKANHGPICSLHKRAMEAWTLTAHVHIRSAKERTFYRVFKHFWNQKTCTEVVYDVTRVAGNPCHHSWWHFSLIPSSSRRITCLMSVGLQIINRLQEKHNEKWAFSYMRSWKHSRAFHLSPFQHPSAVLLWLTSFGLDIRTSPECISHILFYYFILCWFSSGAP